MRACEGIGGSLVCLGHITRLQCVSAISRSVSVLPSALCVSDRGCTRQCATYTHTRDRRRRRKLEGPLSCRRVLSIRYLALHQVSECSPSGILFFLS